MLSGNLQGTPPILGVRHSSAKLVQWGLVWAINATIIAFA